MELCKEVERLRVIADEQNSEFSDYTLMPFGAHKDKRLADVPDDYLHWWFSQHADRPTIILEMDFGPFAQRVQALKNLRLHDYIKRRFKERNDDSEIQGDREGSA
jgi:uncharacterized protein (DUF3820 family)